MIKKNKDEITEIQKRFVNTYIRFNSNGRLAYKHLHPNVTNETADTNACKMLSITKVSDYLEMRREEVRLKERIELSWIIENLNKVIIDCSMEDIERDADGKITSKPDRANLLKAVDLLNKMAGFYAPIKQEVSGEVTNKVIKIGYKKDDE